MVKAKTPLEIRLLKSIGDKPSFDIADFLDRLANVPDWVKLLVAHIYLDHILTETLRGQMPNADAYLLGHKSFLDKLQVCRALGFYENDLGELLKAINSKRNKFAHRLSFDVSAEEKRDLFRTFTKTRSLDDVLSEGGFGNFLSFVVLLAEAERTAQGKKKNLEDERQLVLEELFAVLRKSYFEQ